MSETLYINWSIRVKFALFIFFNTAYLRILYYPVFSGHHVIPRGFNCLRFDWFYNLHAEVFIQAL